MSWRDGECENPDCARETRVVYVQGHGNRCIVCLDKLTEDDDAAAQEVVNQ